MLATHLLDHLDPSGAKRDALSAYGHDLSGAVAVTARIALLVVLGVVVRWLLHRAVGRLVRRAVEGSVPGALHTLRDRARSRLEPGATGSGSIAYERRRQRAETVGSVLRSVSSFAVVAVVGTTALGQLGVDLAPIVASAGIVGVAVGFGAQNLIKDFLTGMFMILEDQYGVGDVIDAGPATGTVEAVGLRSTRLRSVDGTVWHIRNGTIDRIGNKSQNWSRALLDVPVAWETDVAAARTVLKQVADEVWHDEAWAGAVLEEPAVWGVEDLGAQGLLLRLVVKTAPLEQWKVQRELRERIKVAFDAAGIHIGVPVQGVRTVPTGPAS